MKTVWLMILVVLFCATAFAQAPEEGAHEIQIWTAGGHSVPGGRGNTGIWNAGLRYARAGFSKGKV
jgi:hypothetical protein